MIFPLNSGHQEFFSIMENHQDKLSDPQIKQAYVQCLKVLAKRDYSRPKLLKKLKTYGIDDKTALEAIDIIDGEGFLQEDLYIQARIQAFMKKGLSPHFIRSKLYEEQLDVSLEFIEEVFSEHQMDTNKQIQQLLIKKTNSLDLSSCDRDKIFKIKRRLINYLSSKGHGPSQTIDAASNILKKLTCNNSNTL